MNSRVLRLMFLIGVIGALLASVTMASAQDGPEEDGRINAAAEFEYAIYCVDENNNPANAYSTGGIRVLDAQGQEVLFVPNATIVDAGDHPAVNLLLGESETVPGLALYRLTDGGFQLNGFDLHGKAFEFAFYSCAPILPPEPPDEPEDEDEEECDNIIVIDVVYRAQPPGLVDDPCFDPCLIIPELCCLGASTTTPLGLKPVRVSARISPPQGEQNPCCEAFRSVSTHISPPQGPAPCCTQNVSMWANPPQGTDPCCAGFASTRAIPPQGVTCIEAIDVRYI